MRTLAPALAATLMATSAAVAMAQDAYVGPAERATMEALERIEAIDPQINSVLAVDPTALDQARHVDRVRRAQTPLTGIPILLKDNIEAKGPLPTTAGSLALKDNVTGRDSPLVAGLRSAGAVILGKTNLSEWANFRSENSNSGWSAVGGQTRNPYALDRSPCGSSSGSGAAVAAGIVDVAIGTETSGSVVCPAAMNGVVGFKPSIGLVSRTHIVPISVTQDTAGPITQTVFQAAAVMDAITMADPADPATATANDYRGKFLSALDGASLEGVRIGVLQSAQSTNTAALFERAKADLEAAGAVLVTIEDADLSYPENGAPYTIMLHEFRDGLNHYLASTPASVEARTLTDVIAFNQADERELAVFDQSIFEKSVATSIDDPDFIAVRDENIAKAKSGIDTLLATHDVEALIFPTYGTAMLVDHVNGDSFPGAGPVWMAASAGYPHLTVPMGLHRGLPVGLSFVGTGFDDARILALGHAYEQARPALPKPQFLQSVTADPNLAPLLDKAD